MFSACLLEFLNIIAETLVIFAEELANRHYDIHLCCTILDSHSGFCNLYLDKGLRGWEIATYYSDFYAVNLQTLADKAGKVRVGTYGCYVRKLRIILGKLVHLFNHLQDAFFCIFCMERSQLDATEEELLDLHGLILCYLFIENLLYCCSYFLIVEVAVVLLQN